MVNVFKTRIEGKVGKYICFIKHGLLDSSLIDHFKSITGTICLAGRFKFFGHFDSYIASLSKIFEFALNNYSS